MTAPRRPVWKPQPGVVPTHCPTIGELAGHWVRITCGCGRGVEAWAVHLSRQHGADTRLDELLERMRCTDCGGNSATLEMTDDPRVGRS